jgi:hypothetical protein
VAGTYDHATSTTRIYLDGVEQDSGTVSGYSSNSTAGEWEIGREFHDFYYMNGLVDDVRVYDRALSASEVDLLSSADCANPAGKHGTIIYNSTGDGVFQGCVQGKWYAFNDSVACPRTGLVGYWKFDEDSGTTAEDSAGSNDGTLTNMAGTEWTGGRLGNALDFDGTDDYVIDDDAESYLNGLTAATVSVWIKSDVTGVNNGFISNEDSNNDFGITIRYDSSGLYGSGTNVIKAGFGNASLAGPQSSVESSSNVQTTDWQHIVVTWQASQAPVLYINGQLDTPTFTSNSATSIDNLTFFKIGAHGQGEWQGLVDDVRVYNRALSAAEAAALYNGGGGCQ